MAAQSADAYPGERPADARTYAAVRVAVDYWTARGVVGCPDGIVALYASSLADTDGLDASGRGQACRVWLSDSLLKVTRGLGGSRWLHRLKAGYECRHVVHEVGHALGLGHSDAGIMQPEIQPVLAECSAWARALYPRPIWPGRVIAEPLRFSGAG